jgi:hypothetical protein
VDLSQPPADPNTNENYWEDANQVKVITKLEWYTLSKIYPSAEFTFYNRDTWNEYPIETGLFVDLDNPGDGLWTSRNQVRVYFREE